MFATHSMSAVLGAGLQKNVVKIAIKCALKGEKIVKSPPSGLNMQTVTRTSELGYYFSRVSFFLYTTFHKQVRLGVT